MDPNHARYQTSPHPDSQNIIMDKMQCVKCCQGLFPILPEYVAYRGDEMGYRVVYHNEKLERAREYSGRRLYLTVFFLCCFYWMVSFFWPEGKELLKILLIPGNPEATMEAAEVFAEELACGSPLKDAAKNFYQTVLSHGYTA